MSTFIPSDEQLAIAEAVRRSIKDGSSIAIDAGAGTGKTRTARYLADPQEDIIPGSDEKSFVMFNASIKDEMTEHIKRDRIPKATAVTFNGLGYRAMLKRYGVRDGRKEFGLDDRKYKKLAGWLIEQAVADGRIPAGKRAKEDIKDAADMLAKLFNLIRVNTTRGHMTGKLGIFMGGMLDDDERNIYPLDFTDKETLDEIALRYDMDLGFSEDVDVVFSLIPEMFRLGKLGVDKDIATLKRELSGAKFAYHLDANRYWIDFTDQNFYCVVDNWSVSTSKWVIIDEAQDTSPLDRALADMHRERTDGVKTGRVIMVGDPQQAIYLFRGADGQGFDNSMIFWNIEKAYPLSLSYRVPHVVAERAAQHKFGYRAHPSNRQGETATVNMDDLLEMAQDGDAVICRTKAELVVYWRAFVAAGKVARLVGGGDMTEGIKRTLEAVQELEGFRFSKIEEYLAKYRDLKVAKMEERGKPEEAIESFNDQITLVGNLISAIDADTLDELIEQIEFQLNPANQPKGGVAIMTGHVCKGLEFPRVFDGTPKKFPLRWKRQSPEQLEQEENLAYVKDTRAMEGLYFVDPKAPSYLRMKQNATEEPVVLYRMSRGEAAELAKAIASGEPVELDTDGDRMTLAASTEDTPKLPAGIAQGEWDATKAALDTAAAADAAALAEKIIPFPQLPASVEPNAGDEPGAQDADPLPEQGAQSVVPQTDELPPASDVLAKLKVQTEAMRQEALPEPAEDTKPEPQPAPTPLPPITPVVVTPEPQPQFRATGNLQKDLAAYNRLMASEKFKALIGSLTTSELKTLASVIETVIEEREAVVS